MPVKINKGESGKIDMTPMIDVVFQLIIFFMVAIRFEDDEHALDVQLPTASEAMPLTAKPKELFVSISREGGFFVAGQQVTKARLLELLKQSAADNPGRASVIIRADRRVVVQPLIEVMDLCNKAKIKNYKVATEELGGE